MSESEPKREPERRTVPAPLPAPAGRPKAAAWIAVVALAVGAGSLAYRGLAPRAGAAPPNLPAAASPAPAPASAGPSPAPAAAAAPAPALPSPPAASPVDSTRLLQPEPAPSPSPPAAWSKADLDAAPQAEAPLAQPAPAAPARPAAPAPATSRPFAPPRLQAARFGARAPAEFDEPSVMRDGRPVRLDFCYAWEKGCGAPAADAFCRLNGYPGAQSFDVDPRLDARGVPTAVISEAGTFCPGASRGHACDGFKRIVCGNGAAAQAPGLER